jgi:glycosyltransferase involved in cell wall biosynthesis
MNLCFIADFRSPIARNWIEYFVAANHTVHVISSRPVAAHADGLASFRVVPLEFSFLTSRPGVREYLSATGSADAARSQSARARIRLLARQMGQRALPLRESLASIDVLRHRDRVRQIIETIDPDVVHAMRIPHEGILAAEALRHAQRPLLISVWGNDFTLHASHSRLTARGTRRAMTRTTALHADCHRDLRLGREWGFQHDRPTIVLPGNGGVQMDVFRAERPDRQALCEKWHVPGDRPLILNPRGFRPSSVHTDVYFAAVATVMKARPDALFACINMAGHPIAESWRQRLPNPESMVLLPTVSRSEMAELFYLADVTVSPSTHDGTPNTLLEGMACGAFPVAGDIESIREWITHGVNGLLCDARDADAVAACMVRALADDELRVEAASRNVALIGERADYRRVMRDAERFYEMIAGTSASAGLVGAAP